jgi:TetR/AcrR family transcriptional regulator, mexJK operon transcriptional repressor
MESSGKRTSAQARRRERCEPEVRREAIMEAARAIFLERGFARATIDEVVARAGGSKATVYALFGSKEGLFGAIAADLAERFGNTLRTLVPGSSVAETLTSVGCAYLEAVLSRERLALFRLVMGESGRFPDLGDILYRSGPRSILSHFTALFRDWSARGLVEGADPEQLAGQFLGALRGDLFLRSLLNPTRIPTPKEIADHVARVVPLFLRCCSGAA